jgi:DNA-binding transcriptional ArsR family regulator
VNWASWPTTSMPAEVPADIPAGIPTGIPADMPAGIEDVAEQVFTALADPTRRAILGALAAGGPATATDLATRLPVSRQAIAKHLALLADAGLLTPEPGEGRRVRYQLCSAPMQVAQQFLAALARDWDGSLDALRSHLDRDAG